MPELLAFWIARYNEMKVFCDLTKENFKKLQSDMIDVPNQQIINESGLFIRRYN